MFLERTLINKLITWSKNPDRRPLLVEGARQVGKTALLKKFGNEHFESCHYFNFERDSDLALIFSGTLDPKHILVELGIKIQQKIDPNKSLIIFDEIQQCDRALTSLKYFSEDLKGSFVACAGSLLGISLSKGSFPVGQVDRVTLYPISFFEFLLAHNELDLYESVRNIATATPPSPYLTEQLWSLMLDYFCCGGLPDSVVAWLTGPSKLEKIQNIKTTQERIYKDYLADIAKHSGSESAMHIETVFRNIPAQLARAIDGSAKKFQFKQVISGKKSFDELRGPIEWLTRAGLIHQVYIAEKALSPLSAYCKDNRFKLYLFDLGMLRHLSGFEPQQIFAWGDNMYKGFYAENYVLLELLSAGASVPKAWHEGESEIEFVLERASELIPLEVKSSTNARSRSLSIYRERYKPAHTIILAGKTVVAPKPATDGKLNRRWPIFAAGSLDSEPL